MSEYMDYAYRLAEDIGPRFASTEEERNSAEEIAGWLTDAGLQADIEDVACSPMASWPYIAFYGVAVLAALLSRFTGAVTIAMLVLAIAALACFVCERYFKPVFSGLFKNGFSQNVVAKYEPALGADSPRTRKVVVMAHYDSPYSTVLAKPSFVNSYPYLQYVMLAGMILIPVLIILGMLPFAQSFHTILWIITCIIALIPLAGLVFLLLERFVLPYPDGANGNASGVAAMMEVLDLLKGSESVSKRQPTQASGSIRRGEAAAREAGVVPEGATVSYVSNKPERAAREQGEEAPVPKNRQLREGAEEAAAEAPHRKPAMRTESEEPRQEQKEQHRGASSGVKPLQRSSMFNGAAPAPATLPSDQPLSADGSAPEASGQQARPRPAESTPRERVSARRKNPPAWWTNVEGKREKAAEEAAQADEDGEVQVRSVYADIPDYGYHRAPEPKPKEQVSEADRIFESVKSGATGKEAAPASGESLQADASAAIPAQAEHEVVAEQAASVPAAAGDTQMWTTDQLAEAEGRKVIEPPKFLDELVPAEEERAAGRRPAAREQEARGDGRLSHLPSFDDSSAFPANPSYADRTSRADEDGNIFSPRRGSTSAHVARLDNILDNTSDLRQQAPVNSTYEGTIQSGADYRNRASVSSRIPTIGGEDEEGDAFQNGDTAQSSVFTAGSFAAGETGAFIPISQNSGTLPDISGVDQDMIIDDADDTGASAAVTGEFSVPSSVQMPDSHKHRFREFFSRGKKNAPDESEQGAAEWLGVDKNYNPTKEGADIGSWDNFSEGDDDDEWKGGAAQASRGTASYDDMREGVRGMVDRDLLDKEVWFVALGASDAAHMGIESFLANHGSELKGALFINIDSVGAGGNLACLSREGHGPFPAMSDYRLQSLTRKAAANLGIDVTPRELTWMDTDSTKVIRQWHRAITFMRFDGVAPTAWHQASDNCDILESACIAETADLVAEMVRMG